VLCGGLEKGHRYRGRENVLCGGLEKEYRGGENVLCGGLEKEYRHRYRGAKMCYVGD
jgi:hypothetical protein